MIKPATIHIPVDIGTFRQNIRMMGIGNLIELHNIIEEVLLEYEDKKLSSDPQIRKEIELAKKEYRQGYHKPIRALCKKG